MILHCTPPYWHNMPNPALGYLKGFCEANGVHMSHVYWNIILLQKMLDFQKTLGNYPKPSAAFPSEIIILYVCKQLLNSDSSDRTTGDLIFSSTYSREELSEAVYSIRKEIDQHIKENNLHKEPVHGFTLKTHQWLMDMYLINRLKEMNPYIRVVLGGIYNEDQARAYMRILTRADFAVWGEGELPLVHLSRALEDGHTSCVPHLVYREDGEILSTRTSLSVHPSLDSYPFADHSDYFKTMKKVDPFNKSLLIPIWGSRSCPWNKCKFCVLNEEYSYRVRSPRNIVEEMEYQSKKYRISNFQFCDSDVAGSKKRFLTLLNLIIESIRERRKPYRISAEISPLFVDSDTAPLMKRAGFDEIQIGFEAASDSLLEKMQKRQHLIHNIQALKSAHMCNLPLFGLNVIRGIPTEREEDVKESCLNLVFFRFLLHKYRLEPTILLLLKGSVFYDEMPEGEREHWKEDILWREIAPLGIVPDGDRFEFFGFFKNTFSHCHLWDTFEHLLRFYGGQDRSYEWVECSSGSVIEERGFKPMKYTLNRDETDILVFCDQIRSFEELKKKFSHLDEDTLCRMLEKLKGKGLLYTDGKRNCISIVETARKQKTNISTEQ